MDSEQNTTNSLSSNVLLEPNSKVGPSHRIDDNFSLLKIMLADSAIQSSLYRPGEYWLSKTKNAVNEIKRHGLAEFRGFSNAAGLSFTDTIYCDRRSQMGNGIRKPLQFLLESIFPLRQIYNSQVKLTIEYAKESIRLRGLVNSRSPRVRELLDRYIMPYSIAGNCVDFFELDGKAISNHYIDLLNTHDNVAKLMDFSKSLSFFEIGGGFGVNLHLLIENYRNLKKFVYLDIPPNLYVGTQYLKSFYGERVRDYGATRGLEEIKFSNDNELEIFCIAPWQIENLRTPIDIFYNAHSFVEMPKDVVKNYANKIQNLPNARHTRIGLISYDTIDSNTIPPSELKNFFSGKSFVEAQQEIITFENRKNFIFCSTQA